MMMILRFARIPAAALLLAGAACTPSAPAALPAGEPYVRGTVESIRVTASGPTILVRDHTGGCGLNGSADSATRYLRRSSAGGVEAARAADVQTGATVAAYVTGPMTRSCPPMARISALIIESSPSGTAASR